MFEGKEADEDNDTVYDIRVSYIEIYNEEIRYTTQQSLEKSSFKIHRDPEKWKNNSYFRL